MAQPVSLLVHLRKLVGTSSAGGQSDAELLERFVLQRDESAFAALLDRHGPMVLGVCRRLLGDSHQAEDAFQATFLVLVRKAAGIGRRELLANWLYGVALRVAYRARAKGPSHPLPEDREIPDMTADDPLHAVSARELHGVLDDELQRLPSKYRAALVFCYLEGRSVAEAAEELGCPRGTVLSRLARGREFLRARLARRGLALPSALLLGTLEAGELWAAVPAPLGRTTLKAAMACALPEGAAALTSASVASLVEGALHAMFLRKLIHTLAASLLAIVLFTGLGWFALQTLADSPRYPRVVLPEDPGEVILLWDVRRDDLPRLSEQPRLQVRADGTVSVHDPYGEGAPAEERLSAQGLQDVLGFMVHGQGFFALDERQLERQARAEQRRRGPAAGSSTTVIRLRADGQEKELRCAEPSRLAAVSAEGERLAAIERRLEQLASWALAGGEEKVRAALELANAQLLRDFPDAPALTADDLQRTTRGGGHTRIVFERRRVDENASPYSFVFAQVERPAEGQPRVQVRASLAADDPGDTKGFSRRTWDAKTDFPSPIAADKTVKFDYPLVYVRVPRPYPKEYLGINHLNQAGLHQTNAPGAELRLLHPDGRDESLVPVAAHESITDPMVSFDGQWVYFAKFHHMAKGSAHMSMLRSRQGSDIYKIHVPTRKLVQLTRQEKTPNTGAIPPGVESHPNGVHNLAPCPVPGGKVVFCSDRNGYRGVREQTQPALQLFVMDDDGSNVELIGPLNLGTALHPVPLKDGRVMFSSLETQGLRGDEQWGIWAIHPDGTNWGPLTSALGSPPGQAVHFQAQLSDESIVVESYYQTGSTDGFGTYWKFPLKLPAEAVSFGPGARRFAPYDLRRLTLFASFQDIRPNHPVGSVSNETIIGNVTHPSAAPDNHLLTVWALPSDAQDQSTPVYDAGIYLLKSGRPINHPSKMLLVKNEPGYQELWPRALVPYRRIYGVDEPRRLVHHNDGKKSPHLPAGTPFGLVGTSSLYKRESYPGGIVPPGSVTAVSPKAGDRKQQWRELAPSLGNWSGQGADAGLYENKDIWGIRIVILEPVSEAVHRQRRHYALGSHGEERLRILGEFPVRKFLGRGEGEQPLDPDGNPDTSFLAKIPADVAWTFQTLDNNGMVLNMAQTWHQVRPGEIRNDCGGCHAHSQKPTPFDLTAAARPDYKVWDLTRQTPLFTTRANDKSGGKWDTQNKTGLRHAQGVQDVEFYRDVKPILERSCVACHSVKHDKPAAGLALDDYRPYTKPGWVTWSGFTWLPRNVPQTYARLAQYSPPFQSRRSLVIWKIYGQRLDGFRNEDIDSPPLDYDNDQHILNWGHHSHRQRQDVDYTGSAMPPPEAIAGTYKGPDGRLIKVPPLSDEDKLTLVRWIDLGSPIDLDDPMQPQRAGGWLLDEGRPTLALASPLPGPGSEPLTHILLGMHDYGSGLDLASLSVTADFEIDGIPPGENLAARLKPLPDNRWELRLQKPITALPTGRLTVSVKDRQGNISKIERTFSVVR